MLEASTVQTLGNDGPRFVVDDRTYRAVVAAKLSVLLAATYHLIIESHLYHWAVVEPAFGTVHEVAEDHYGQLRRCAEDVIGRLQELGHPAPHRPTLSPQFGLARGVTAVAMGDAVAGLVADHEDAQRQLTRIGYLADEAEDDATGELVAAHLAIHERAITRLRAVVLS